MKKPNMLAASEVVRIESQAILDRVDVHGGDKPGIVNLYAGYAQSRCQTGFLAASVFEMPRR